MWTYVAFVVLAILALIAAVPAQRDSLRAWLPFFVIALGVACAVRLVWHTG